MDVLDIVVAVIIAGFVVLLLYRAVWKKRGGCAGCEVSDCDQKTRIECDSLLKLSDLETKQRKHDPSGDNPR